MSKNARVKAIALERKKKMADQQLVIHAEVVVFFKPDQAPANLIPKDGWKNPPFVCKAFRQSTLQIQAMSSRTVVTIDEGPEGSRHFFHWSDIAHIEIVDSRIESPTRH